MTELRPLRHSVAQELHNVVNMQLNEREERRASGFTNTRVSSVLVEVTEAVVCRVFACCCGKRAARHVCGRWLLKGNESAIEVCFSV